MERRLPARIVAPVPRERRKSEPDSGARVPFWAHQLAEILLGVVLLFEGARTGTHVGVLVAGIVLLVFSVITDGPLSVWPLIPRRVHRIGDFVFAALFAVSPFLLGVEDAAGIVLLGAAAVVMLWLGLRTDFRAPSKRRGRRTAPPTPSSPPSTADPKPAQAPAAARPTAPSARDAGRTLGRLRTGGVRAVGRAVGKANAERASEGTASTERATEKAPPPPGPGKPGDEPSPE
jgi:uncharacterized membrane protein YhaH (DUF805 family)